ncbi:unnamed protein product [Aphanomyces euteiches]
MTKSRPKGQGKKKPFEFKENNDGDLLREVIERKVWNASYSNVKKRWINIASALSIKYGVHITWQECQTRFDSLLETFKSIKSTSHGESRRRTVYETREDLHANRGIIDDMAEWYQANDQLYQPPTQTYYSYGALTPHPTASAESTPEEENWLWFAITSPFRPTTYLLIVYFLVNLVFAVISFAVVVALASIGVGLIPLCCIGLVVFQLLLFAVYFMALCDVFLYNCTAPQNEQITVRILRQRPYHYSGHGLSPNFDIFSKESVVAVLYFIVVKFPMAIILSAISLTLLASAILFLSFPKYKDDYINHRGFFRDTNQRIYRGYRDVETIEPD